jgi:hypothetical protein
MNAAGFVIYDPDAPDHAAIPTFDGLWLGQVMMGAMGVVSFGSGWNAVRCDGAASGLSRKSAPFPVSPGCWCSLAR